MPTFTQIGSAVTVGSGGAASITFTSIPSTFTDLVVKVSGRSSRNEFVASYLTMQLNSSTTDYTYRVIDAIPGISTSSATQASYTTSAIVVGGLSQANSTSSTFGSNEIYIPNYAGSTNKSISAEGVSENNTTSTILLLSAGLWSNTSAITSITLKPFAGGSFFNFLEHSTAYLYGVSNA